MTPPAQVRDVPGKGSSTQPCSDPLDLFRLDGRTAVVTGGGRGIGRALALGLASAGADVCVAARSGEELEAVVDEVRGLGRRGLAVVTDLRDPDAPQSVVERTVEAFGTLDILVNNAGASEEKAPFAEVPMAGWEQYLRLLLTVPAALAQQAVRAMLASRRGGVIVNVASIYGLRGAPGGEKELGSTSYYAAAKHGLVGLTRALAIELAPFGIRVNALCPGWVDTSMNPIASAPPAFLVRNLDQIPMGRWATPDEMIGPLVFLTGAASSFMTGQTLVIDGGHLA